MSYLGIYTNNIKENDLSDYKKAETIKELEQKPTKKRFLKIYKLTNDILEEAELLETKILR